MMEPELFRSKLLKFPCNYMQDFDSFWRWKLKVETKGGHILDERHRETTYYKLRDVLANWQTYRSSRNSDHWGTLKRSLEAISDAYDQLRMFTILEFNVIPNNILELTWHELGRVKEYNASRNDVGHYYVISICKPLMLLWGQTLAFDSRVRANIPYRYSFLERNRWTLKEWKIIMESLQRSLQQNSEMISYFRKESLKKYGNENIVPFGRFMDI
ncbi:MAG: hypothetical protein ACPLRY_08910, partial [Candidatus Bathyarchaeales archaeon]